MRLFVNLPWPLHEDTMLDTASKSGLETENTRYAGPKITVGILRLNHFYNYQTTLS